MQYRPTINILVHDRMTYRNHFMVRQSKLGSLLHMRMCSFSTTPFGWCATVFVNMLLLVGVVFTIRQ